MDPDATLEELLDLAEVIQDDISEGGEPDRDETERLVDLVTALHCWLRKGGALPKAWERDDD